MAPETAQQYLARDLWNTPVPLVRRTPRELVCVGVGLWILFSELRQPAAGKLFYVNLVLAVTFTLAFLLRFFLARILASAAAFSAGAQWWIGREQSWVAPWDQNWRAYACVVVLAVLTSPDLVRRFDRGSVPRWWPNPWAILSRLNLALARWSLYLLCMVTALVHQGYAHHLGTPQGARVDWVPGYTACIGLVFIAQALGRRSAVLALPALYLWSLYHLLPRPAPLGQLQLAPPLLFAHTPHVAQPAMLIAAVGLALSLWLSVRYLRGRLD